MLCIAALSQNTEITSRIVLVKEIGIHFPCLQRVQSHLGGSSDVVIPPFAETISNTVLSHLNFLQHSWIPEFPATKRGMTWLS